MQAGFRVRMLSKVIRTFIADRLVAECSAFIATGYYSDMF
jgi:hypothetical protein